MKYFLVLSIWVFGATTFASDESVCTNLHRLACAPGKYDDGTGVAQNLSAQASSTETYGMDVAKVAKEKLRIALAKPENKRFRENVLSATGLNASPFCKEAAISPNEECLEQMAIGASDVMHQQLNGNLSNIVNPSAQTMKEILNDQVLMADSRPYREIQAELSKQLKSALPQTGVEKQVREKVFPGVQKLLIEKIGKMVSDPKIAASLVEKIKAIEFDGTDCGDFGGGKATIPSIFMSNAYYVPSQNVFRYCSALGLRNRSEFQMAYVVAHELAHAVDPCGITVGPTDFTFKFKPGITRAQAEAEFPFPGVIGCLRSDKSVLAFDSSVGGPNLAAGGYYNFGSNVSAAAPAFKDFCSKDQITEAFADWMATEVLPDYIASNFPKLSQDQIRVGYSNVWRGMCDKSSAGGEQHPAQNKRMDTILLAHPSVRKQMGCGPITNNLVYCELGQNSAASAPVMPFNLGNDEAYKTPKVTK